MNPCVYASSAPGSPYNLLFSRPYLCELHVIVAVKIRMWLGGARTESTDKPNR